MLSQARHPSIRIPDRRYAEIRLTSLRLIEIEIREPFEVATITRRHGEAVMQHGCRDQEIHLADWSDLLLKRIADDHEVLHDLQVERNGHGTCDERAVQWRGRKCNSLPGFQLKRIALAINHDLDWLVFRDQS
jgi:hypothetical protein